MKNASLKTEFDTDELFEPELAEIGLELHTRVIVKQSTVALKAVEQNDQQSFIAPAAKSDFTPASVPLLKRSMDIVGALIGLVLLMPVFAVLALLVSRDGGPVFYGQRRISRAGKEFRCWKFRSMVPNADKVLEELLANNPRARAEWDKDFKLKNDPRITKIGNILRKTSLDELPQLLNVLVGEMSLVGPRPITRTEMAYYGDDIRKYLAVCPGITGLWQVSGRNDVTYDERVALDVSYVDGWSLPLDIGILFKTVKVMAFRSGAY